MTTYSYTITLNDSEYLCLGDALEFYRAHCEKMVAEKAGAPFWAHVQSCQSISTKLRGAITHQMSGNTFSDDM
jgi:hypothetical protein